MIQINKLDFAYNRRRALFEGLDLHLASGKVYGLLGKNGTGKSTLLKLMVGGLFPKDGTVVVDGDKSLKRRASTLSEIYFLPEDYVVPSIPIKQYVRAYSSFYPRFSEKDFYQYLELFEVPADRDMTNLSFGQKKKVMISFGLACNVRYLLLDEPTNGLDIPSKSQFRKVMISGIDEDQLAVISTHQIRDLNQLIESVLIIEDGRIIFNKNILEIEDKLKFSKSLTMDNGLEYLYSESVPGGYIHISRNETGGPSEVELEVLFNAVIENKSTLHQYF